MIQCDYLKLTKCLREEKFGETAVLGLERTRGGEGEAE